MKTTKHLLGIMALAIILFTSCGKENNGGSGDNSLASTRWEMFSPNDQTYHCDVTFILEFGQNKDVTFTRHLQSDADSYDYTQVMTGTYTYSKGSGVALLRMEGDSNEYRITFTVSGNTLIWHFSLKDYTLTKV